MLMTQSHQKLQSMLSQDKLWDLAVDMMSSASEAAPNNMQDFELPGADATMRAQQERVVLTKLSTFLKEVTDNLESRS